MVGHMDNEGRGRGACEAHQRSARVGWEKLMHTSSFIGHRSAVESIRDQIGKLLEDL